MMPDTLLWDVAQARKSTFRIPSPPHFTTWYEKANVDRLKS